MVLKEGLVCKINKLYFSYISEILLVDEKKIDFRLNCCFLIGKWKC